VSALQRKRIVEMCKCEGERVVKGQVLARLDDVEERAVLTELEARLARLGEDAERLKGLTERNVTSRVAYEEKLTQVREYEARVAAQKDRLSDLELKAPMDGVVLRRDGEVGEIAGINATDVLFWVGQPKPLRIVAEVNEEDIARVHKGQTVLVRHEGFEEGTLRAKVDELTPKGDPTTKTFRVYFSLPDDTPLKIGMSVEANIVVREAKGALLVPAEALVNGSVQVVQNGRVRRRAVKTGIKGTRMVEILDGLAGDAVVLSPARGELRDGARVLPIRSAAK
jgi:RND family efflux transporter MFP subunit